MEKQMSLFTLETEMFKITKPLRIIELFAGYGSLNLALKYAGIKFESWKTCEWAVKSIQAYKDVHTEDTTDYSKDLSIEELNEYLTLKGISADYSNPMSYVQVKRLSEINKRTIYNNIQATKNLVNITQVHGKDLEIVDTDKYDYVLSYSFPCQDISLAGKRQGLDKNSNTRSGMLWEVERILNELETKPQILIMENVGALLSENMVGSFGEWLVSLEKMGYTNHFQILNSVDYGVPQNRGRVFMFSFLGKYDYAFPEPIKLKKRLKDLLEKNVDEKYYLSKKMIEYFMSDGTGSFPTKDRFIQNITRKNQDVGNAVTTLAGNRPTDNFVIESYGNKALDETLEKNEVEDGDFIDAYNRNVKKGVAGTITTRVSESNNIFVAETLDVIKLFNINPSGNGMNGNVYSEYGAAPTLTTNKGEGIKIAVEDELIPKCLGGIGEKDSNNNTQWKQQNRIYDNNVAISITTSYLPWYAESLSRLRIRKLTPRECFRLMGVRDDDFDKIAKNQSNSSLYHLAGDSVVVDVYMALFKEMIKCLKL